MLKFKQPQEKRKERRKMIAGLRDSASTARSVQQREQRGWGSTQRE
jgi:hypothetical protein